ncbi:MAG: glycoside hydrolase family 16 protein [Tannerella sp.]|jgi:beta-glucanase (GH16 family)|nr:glycoside hydrolase family 16 protein [Tannerella sp.]
MKQIIIIALCILTSCTKLNTSSDGWKLVWEDNFDGDVFDRSHWSRITRGTVEWNKYMSLYEPLVEVADGQLIVRGIVNNVLPDDTMPYLTGGVTSQNRVGFGNGRLEIRAKLGKARGAWPAFWMLPYDNTWWPYHGEIDIMEHLNGDDIAYQTVHSEYTVYLGGTDPPKGSTGKIDPDDYNIYAVEMYPDSLSFYINNNHTFTYPRVSDDVQFPFDREFFLLIDMQLGGSWVGKVEPADLPVEMWIDWVRFYKLQ